MQSYSGEEELCCVNVPTNHLYIGDIFLINTTDVIRPNLSVRERICEGSTSFVVKGKKNLEGLHFSCLLQISLSFYRSCSPFFGVIESLVNCNVDFYFFYFFWARGVEIAISHEDGFSIVKWWSIIIMEYLIFVWKAMSKLKKEENIMEQKRYC